MLSHEMTHIWQDQTGQMNYVKLAYQDATIPDGGYDISKVGAYTAFNSLGYEQQATVVERFYQAQVSGNTWAASQYGQVIESGGLLGSGFKLGGPLSKMVPGN